MRRRLSNHNVKALNPRPVAHQQLRDVERSTILSSVLYCRISAKMRPGGPLRSRRMFRKMSAPLAMLIVIESDALIMVNRLYILWWALARVYKHGNNKIQISRSSSSTRILQQSLIQISNMRRAAQEAKKSKTSKQFEFTPSTLYLLFYNAAQAFGLVSAF